MKKNNHFRVIFAIAMMLSVALPTLAHDFEVDGIYYNYLDETAKTVEVTYKGLSAINDPNEYSGDVEIPTSVTYSGTSYSVTAIGKNAFFNCTELTSIRISSSITNIEVGAFYGCNKLSSLIIEDSEVPLSLKAQSVLTNLGKGTFYDSTLETIYLGRNLLYESNAQNGYSPFYSKKTLKSVTISKLVTEIEDYCFYKCSGLTIATIPNSVVTIGKHAFEGCSSLTGNLVIPNSVKSIGSSAFGYCKGFVNIEIPNSVESIGSDAFIFCSGLTGTLIIPNSVTSIGKAAFFGCSKLTSINIPNTVTTIENQTFYQCEGLISIELPNSVTSIGSAAFYECLNLKSIKIPSTLMSIGDIAFKKCSNLTSASIPKSVTYIGENSFNGCTALKNVFYNAVNCTSTKNISLECSNSFAISKDVINIPDSLNYTGQLGKVMITFPTTPPICGTNSFTLKTKTKTVLYVPKGSYAAYWSAPVWQDFKNIVEIGQVATSISLPESLDLTLNNTIKLDATFAPINTTITSLIWESSNPEVAIVDQEGNVTAVANGKATITATTIDGSELSASCEVKIGIQEVESITLSQKTAEIKPKDMLNLTCVVSPDNATEKTISWTSDNTSVAVVRTNSDGSATVLAVAPGVANITAATNDGTNLSDTCVVKVLKLAESITLDKTTAIVNIGNTIDVTATILPDDADYKNVTWSISDETLATIKTNENGSVSVSAINPGVVTVTATTVDGSNLSASCEINITKLAESIALDKEKISMVTGHEETLVATVLPDNTSNKSIAWTLSDATLATLKDNGDGTASITAINPGVVNVTVTTTDGTELFASCEITIIQLATSISLDKETISIEEGKSEILTATVMPDNTSNKIVEWSSSDESIATVVDNNDGTAAITVHKKGVTTITATTTDGSNLSATCEVSGLSGILGIEVDCIGEKRYDIHGRLLSKPSPGLNIIIKNDGTTRKEIIK